MVILLMCGYSTLALPYRCRKSIIENYRFCSFLEHDRQSENVLRTQCGTNQYASQKGETPMGANRMQVRRGGVLSAATFTKRRPASHHTTSFKVPKISYKKEWETVLDKEGEKILPKQCGDFGYASQAGEVSDLTHRTKENSRIYFSIYCNHATSLAM